MFGRAGYSVSYRDPRLGARSVNHIRRCSPQHMHGALLEATLRLDRFDLVFMVTREPVARFRSEYAYTQRHHRLDLSGPAVEAWADEAFARYRGDPFVLDNHLRPQVEFMVPGVSVFRLEDGLGEIARRVSDRLPTPLGAVPRVLDRSEHAGVASSEVQLTDSLERRLRTFYARDYEEFGYAV